MNKMCGNGIGWMGNITMGNYNEQKVWKWDWLDGRRGNYLALCSYPLLRSLLARPLARFPLYHTPLQFGFGFKCFCRTYVYMGFNQGKLSSNAAKKTKA